MLLCAGRTGCWAEVTGDDGSRKLVFGGTTVLVYSAHYKKYATLAMPEGSSIEGMLREAAEPYRIDFPLADFVGGAASRVFLTDITSGRVVDTVTMDLVPYDYLLFFQPPGIELELWLSKTEQALPRRLIVRYRSLCRVSRISCPDSRIENFI